MVSGKGIVIIAPTGAGKSTHSWGLLKLSTGKILSDDWIFLKYKKGLAMADVSEKKFYLRTDMIKSFPEPKAAIWKGASVRMLLMMILLHLKMQGQY